MMQTANYDEDGEDEKVGEEVERCGGDMKALSCLDGGVNTHVRLNCTGRYRRRGQREADAVIFISITPEFT
jgi:hypothetical protein